jgi:hypothetical protein
MQIDIWRHCNRKQHNLRVRVLVRGQTVFGRLKGAYPDVPLTFELEFGPQLLGFRNRSASESDLLMQFGIQKEYESMKFLIVEH